MGVVGRLCTKPMGGSSDHEIHESDIMTSRHAVEDVVMCKLNNKRVAEIAKKVYAHLVL